MQELGPAAPVMSPEEIIARWGDDGGELHKLVAACRDDQYEFERLVLIRKARYNWRMVNCDQFIAPGYTADWTGTEMVDFVSVDTMPDPEQNGAQVAFSYPINVLGGDCYKFVAVMGQSAPRVKMIADDLADRDNLQKAKEANAVLREKWQKLEMDKKWRTLAFHQFTTGPIFVHTPWVVDAERFGASVEPNIQISEVPQADGSTIPVPAEGGIQNYPNGDVDCELCTVFEVAGTYGVRELSDWGWLIKENMVSKFKLLKAYPEELEKYRNVDPPDGEFGASTVAANEARESVSNPSGVGRPKKTNDWRLREIWLRPWMFEAVEDKLCRETLKRQYQNGLYIAKVNDVIVQLDDRTMDDEWAVCKTGRGEKIYEPPIANDSVPIQRALNDMFNLAIETVLRSIAKTIVDQMLLDRNSVSKNEALPAEMIFTATPMGTDLTKMITQIPPARVSDQLVPLIQLLRTYQQDITGIRPELSGGGQPTATFREAKQRKDQALAQLGPQADEMQACAEQIARNIVKQMARHGNGIIKSSQKGTKGITTDIVDLASLGEDGYHPEADDNWPMTAADVFDKLWGLLKEFPPEVQQQLGILDALNIGRNLELLQLPGYESPNEDQKAKTLSDIQKLLQGKPQPGAPGPDGKPGPQQPSIPIDGYDDHAFVADFTRKWMVSQDGQQANASNPQGFDNVAAFQQAHFAQANPPAPPPPPPVKASLSVSVDGNMNPQATNELLQGAGLPAMPLPAPPQAPPPALGAPGPVGPPAPPQSAQQSPLPPAPPLPGPAGPPPSGPPPAPMLQ